MDDLVEFFDRSSWGLMLARVNHLSEADVVFWFALIVVFGCIVAAAVAAWRGVWLVTGLLVLVAFVTALLFL